MNGPLEELSLALASSPALAQTVSETLREAIAEGRLAPGQHLREVELADAMGVSRGPVREALVQLEREGLVVLRRHRGAQVAQLSRADIEELYTLRLALERLAVERAVVLAEPDHFAAMDEVLARMGGLRADYSPREATLLDLEFHDLVYRAAGHARLQRSWEQIRSQIYTFLFSRNVLRHDFSALALREHRAIRDLLAKGDATSALTAIESHLEGAYRRLVDARDRSEDGGDD